MNIILIVIDTLRYDYIGANDNNWIKTPNMDRLAEKSWVFDRCFANSYPTIPHRTDVMTGLYGDPFNRWMPLKQSFPTIPRTLAAAGYATQLIHDTPHLANGGTAFDWPFHAWEFIRGAEVDRPWIGGPSPRLPENWAFDPVFDPYDRDAILGDKFKFIPYCHANRHRKKDEDWNVAKTFLTAAEFLRDNKDRDNFFLWLDCFDPHEPWDIPPEYAKMYDKDPDYDGRIDPRGFVFWKDPDLPQKAKDRLAAWYAGKVSWVDRWLGEALNALEETGLDKNTAIILTADHGTNVGERGIFSKDIYVREQEGHVPLFIHVPGRGSGRSSIWVQPQDIFATVAGIAGAEMPTEVKESFDVLSIAEKGKEPTRTLAIAGTASHTWKQEKRDCYFSVFDDEYYLLYVRKPEECALYRYGELPDIASDHPDVVARLRELGIKEMKRRRASPHITEWLESEDERKMPKVQGPEPEGWHGYFGRNYMQWK